MRDLIKVFVKICAETFPLKEPIYEFGSLQVPGQEGFADLRSYFPNKEYIGADIREGTGVDVILNLHDINLPSESIGTVLILDTIEHVEFTRKAISEIYRILKPEGIVILSSVMNFPIHSYPYDYWRFTPAAFESLLSSYKCSIVDYIGEKGFPHTIIGIGFKGLIPRDLINQFNKRFNNFKNLLVVEKGRVNKFVSKIFNILGNLLK